jgi:hypothetical protein
VLPDSKRLAELMISIKAEYSPFLQLGMDMLKRLRCHDPILSELLLRDNVMQAVQYARDNAILDKLAPSQFLLAAQMSGDPLIFYNTFRFMEQRNYYLHGTRQFQQNEGCDQFVDYFNRLFPQ